MSTRSVIAESTGPAAWAGTFCHWDGYPSHMLPNLRQIVAETFAGDVAKAREALLSRRWESLYVQIPDDIRENHSRRHWTEIVEGLGVAVKGPVSRLTSGGDPGALQWAYVLTDDELRVSMATQAGWRQIATLPWDAVLTPEHATTIECGSDWSRCSHMARVHDPAVPRDSRYGMQQWIGAADADHADYAVAVVVGETRVELTGSYCQGTHRRSGVKDGPDVTTLRLLKNSRGRLLVDHVLPPTKHLPERTLKAGTIVAL